MEIALVVIAFIFLVVGFLGSIIPALPGPPLSFIGLLILQRSGYGGFSPAFLWIWAAITIAVTVMDNILPAIMTKKFGGSKMAVNGSIIGIFAGMFVYPPIGILVGPFLGALIGELLSIKLKQRRAAASLAANSAAENTAAASTSADNAASVPAKTNIAAKQKNPLIVAFGAFLAFIVGTGGKLIIAGMMVVYAVRAMLNG